MKRTIITSIAILFFSVLAFAQPPGGGQGMQFDPEAMVKRQTDEMVELLNLNADQTEKVQKLNEKYQEKQSEMFQGMQGGGDFASMREKMETMNKEKAAELKEILTEEQFAKYEKSQEERQQRMREMGGGGPGGAGAPPARRERPRN
ncbi:MAG: hypothetical protein JXR50_11630 [Prolixibacteraceae bacterium]|nr:hypothetical protein [Prolixibacteraceae bacterium]MBN2650380.1 hypothetical protein [Prolixibacteraceae bacterium]